MRSAGPRSAGAVAFRADPGDVAGGENVRIGVGLAVVLRLTIEQGAGDLRRQIARLRGPVIELRDLQVAVADAERDRFGADAGHRIAAAVVDPDPGRTEPHQAGLFLERERGVCCGDATERQQDREEERHGLNCRLRAC